MEDFLESALPTLLTAALFLVLASAVVRALVRPLGKVALVVGVLVAVGLLPVPAVQEALVGLVTFFFETFGAAYHSVVLGG